jgi:hypothetical protein
MVVSARVYNVLKIRLKKEVVANLQFVAGLEDGFMAGMHSNIFRHEMVALLGVFHANSENIFVARRKWPIEVESAVDIEWNHGIGCWPSPEIVQNRSRSADGRSAL